MAAGNISINKQKIEYLFSRGVSEIIVKDELEQLLRSGKKLRLKFGLDPSAPDITLGHTVVFRKLRQFQELGHRVILIVGDWTAQIGDPSGVSATRKMLSAEQVKENADTYMKQFFMVVDKEKTEIKWQSEWFGRFDLADVVKLTSKFTVAQFLAREDFNKRFNEQKPIAITELLYPLLQAYDSVAIQADVEFGGTDQKFNLLVGRELQSMVGQKPQQIFMTPLLVGTDGVQKMSKSLGNYIGIAEPPEDIYGKTMSIKDDFILTYFELLTDVPAEELAEFKKQMENGVNPMILKKRLAREILNQLYSLKEAREAEAHFKKTVQKKELPDEIEEYKFSFNEIAQTQAKSVPEARKSGGIEFNKFDESTVGAESSYKDFYDISRIIVYTGQAKSRSEAMKLIMQGAVSIKGKKIDGNLYILKSGDIIKVGKRSFAKVFNTDK